MINVFRRGSLVMQQAGESGPPIQGSILFGTVQGAIGLIAQLPESYFKFLQVCCFMICSYLGILNEFNLGDC